MSDFLCEEKKEKVLPAMAFVPRQQFDKLYDNLEEGFCNGTVFPELNKPFIGRRCVS